MTQMTEDRRAELTKNALDAGWLTYDTTGSTLIFDEGMKTLTVQADGSWEVKHEHCQHAHFNGDADDTIPTAEYAQDELESIEPDVDFF